MVQIAGSEEASENCLERYSMLASVRPAGQDFVKPNKKDLTPAFRHA